MSKLSLITLSIFGFLLVSWLIIIKVIRKHSYLDKKVYKSYKSNTDRVAVSLSTKANFNLSDKSINNQFHSSTFSTKSVKEKEKKKNRLHVVTYASHGTVY
jgi:hypothetical protein